MKHILNSKIFSFFKSKILYKEKPNSKTKRDRSIVPESSFYNTSKENSTIQDIENEGGK